MAISKQQSMRPAEIELIDASNQHESTLQEHAQSLETLDENLNTETTDRETADTALGTRIDNEAQARTDADTALGTRIDEVIDSVSLKNTVSSLASLDDLPLNGFGLVESIASDIRPDTWVTAALYLSFGEGEGRAVMFIRYGDTQAWLNTRNANGWHGWKPLVEE